MEDILKKKMNYVQVFYGKIKEINKSGTVRFNIQVQTSDAFVKM